MSNFTVVPDEEVKNTTRYREAFDEIDRELVSTGMTIDDYPDVRSALSSVICWHNQTMVDWRVNGGDILVPITFLQDIASSDGFIDQSSIDLARNVLEREGFDESFDPIEEDGWMNDDPRN